MVCSKEKPCPGAEYPAHHLRPTAGLCHRLLWEPRCQNPTYRCPGGFGVRFVNGLTNARCAWRPAPFCYRAIQPQLHLGHCQCASPASLGLTHARIPQRVAFTCRSKPCLKFFVKVGTERQPLANGTSVPADAIGFDHYVIPEPTTASANIMWKTVVGNSFPRAGRWNLKPIVPLNMSTSRWMNRRRFSSI